jgi:preprotein translocase subunit SecA
LKFLVDHDLVQPITQPLAQPGPLWGSYPERAKTGRRKPHLFTLKNEISDLLQRNPINRAVHQRAVKIYSLLNNSQPINIAGLELPNLRSQLRQTQCSASAIDAALLQVAFVARQTMQWSAFSSQIECAILLIEQSFVELATGEGKSLAMALAASVLALAGSPVHALTANEYLAKRDAELFEPLFRALELQVSFTGEQANRESQRKAFAADITYTTTRCVGFAYLKDRLETQDESRVLRGLCCALIDEADVTLLDEALTPLVLSQQVNDPNERLMAFRAIETARQLIEHDDWIGSRQDRVFSVRGGSKLKSLPIHPWLTQAHRQEQVLTALHALNDLALGRDYLVHDKEIQIIDVFSGRVAQGRQWGNGLHAMIAVKEGITAPKQTVNLASIHYPRLLQRYHHLAGLSGTLLNDKNEIEKNYQCPVFLVKPHHNSVRKNLPPEVFDSIEQAHALLADQIKVLTSAGRPVLIATQDVNQTQAVESVLLNVGISTTTLSAQNESIEANVIARAGHAGAVTIATQMAGRGTDIKLDAIALKAGGLAIVSLQMNQSQRTDQQVMGRAGRQGQTGSTQQWIIRKDLTEFAKALGILVSKNDDLVALHKEVQSVSQNQHRFQRSNSIRSDRLWLERKVF